MNGVYSSYGGIKRLHLNTANTRTICYSHSNVAIFSPSRSPRVSDCPELHQIWDTPTNNNDCMIESGTTQLIVKNSTLVILEQSLVSFNRNGKWSSSQSNFHCIGIICCNIYISCGSLTCSVCSIILASSISPSIGVLSSSHSEASFVVIVSFVLPAAVTTKVSQGAINHLLFWEVI